jgi:tripartite-type tricarboxylate transporter receptor subunit TctC
MECNAPDADRARREAHPSTRFPSLRPGSIGTRSPPASRWARVALGAALIALLRAALPGSGAGMAHAADARWPARPLHIIVAQSPGGPPDLIARFIAEPLERALGVPVVVENRPGAAGIVGITAAAQAAPDGHTLVIGTLSTHVLVPQTSRHATFDPLRDFVPVINLFRSVKVLWVQPSLPVHSLPEWAAYVAARPGALNFASGGVGSSNHIDMAVVNAAFGLDAVHVPYNGPSAGIAALASGDAQAMIVSVGTGLPLAKAGRVRPIAVFSERRAPQLPDVPTAAEQGNGQGRIDLSAWIGLFAPAGTPAPVIERLNATLAAVLQAPDTTAWSAAQGLEIIGGAPAAFGATLAADHRRWGGIVRRLHLVGE